MNRLEMIQEHIVGPSLKVSTSRQGSVGYIKLCSAKDLNALSIAMMQQIVQALSRLADEDEVKVIVLCSQLPRIFCAGADIKMFSKMEYETLAKKEIFEQLEEGFRNVNKIIIAAINGKALGGGFELALLCDTIVCSDNASFGLPEVNLGLIPGMGGTQRLTRIIGEKLAMRYILTGESMTGGQANKYAIAHLVSSEQFMDHVSLFANTIASKALVTLIAAKKAIRAASNSTLHQGLDYEKNVFTPLVSSKAAKVGVNAFLTKTKPDFSKH